MIIDCITVWQPWASLIAIGAKPYEFRGWVPPKHMVGKPLAIHAGARPARKDEVCDILFRLQRRDAGPHPCLHAEIAVPFLEKVLAGLDAPDMPIFGEPAFRLPQSAVVCTAILGQPKRGEDCAGEFGIDVGNDSDRPGTFNWGWPLTGIQEVLPPEPARGRQGFWKWSAP